MHSLVIVESPAKAKTINKILGKGFEVMASVGHVKDLPKKDMGVDIENDFSPQYVVIKGKEKIIKGLKAAAKGAENVYLAPDPDREGEAIAFHIASEISDKKGSSAKVFRVIFNEITERAVKEGMKNAGKIDMHKVDAQQARRILDRLVGYKLSPLLWRKVRRGLSAGRVQSVAVRLVVEREREVEAFKEEEYWSIKALFEGSMPPRFQAGLHKYNDTLVIDRAAEEGKQFLIKDRASAEDMVNAIRGREFVLEDVEKKLRKRMPYPPFITSTLQQEAARKLGFPAKKTMMVAQQLYEGIELGEEGSHGLITYMRTDSVRVAREAQEWARQFIDKTYGKDYLPEKPPQYKSKGSAQEAHEAIRPTSFEKPLSAIKPFLTKDQHNLYTLIWNRFISSQMNPAVLEQTVLTIASDSMVLRASGNIMKFNGFMAVYTETADDGQDEEEGLLPSLKAGEKLRLIDVTPSQHFTQPPPRYTEASLVKSLEEKGIGRPSTYAAILSTITDRKYVLKEDGKFHPTELGVVVNDFLVEKFPELIDFPFTARMEDELDRVEDGKLKWVNVVREFYKPFSHDLDEAAKTEGRVKPKDIPTDKTCEKCGSPMLIKWGRHGRFMACSGYPKCKNTMPLNGDKAEPPQQTNEVCEKCGSPMVIKSGRFGNFIACSAYPNCKNIKSIPIGVKCPLDAGDIVEKRSRKGKPFWSCANYPKCKFASWYKPLPRECPKCGAGFIFEKKDKQGSTSYLCHDKNCGYKEDIKNTEDEA